jgi:hypothetical protein
MTALQELIQYLGASNPMDYTYFLEKEKNQIINACNIGIFHGGKFVSTGEQYYNETYSKGTLKNK